MAALVQALTLQAGYNSALATLGAALLGMAAGGAGTFIFLRKRALISDALAHATLPGVAAAFIFMVALGGDGRSLPGLLAGSALSGLLGLLAVEWIARRTRLPEDTAIGAVLSVFFGIGVVMLTVIQTMEAGRQAGLESFLLGSTAGMLFADAALIAAGGAAAAAAVILLRRPMTLVAFDPGYAMASGVNVRAVDLAMMGLALGVTVVGLKLVGLILIVAMLIIPPVAARFWTDRTDRLALIAAGIGGASGYLGAAISASAPDAPTGPIIVLVCFALFAASLFAAPGRGALAELARRRRFQLRVHRRQGLLSMARREPIYDALTLRVLGREGLIRPDGTPTQAGRAQAGRALLDEARWEIARRIWREEAVSGRYDGLTPMEDVLTRDEIAEVDARLPGAPA